MTSHSANGTAVDLSLEIFNGMPAHALFPSPIILPYVTHEQAKSAGLGEPGDPFTYAVNYISMLEHVGTHVDAPLHIGDGGQSIDQVPLERFSGRAVCLDLRHIPDLGDIDVPESRRPSGRAGVHISDHIVLCDRASTLGIGRIARSSRTIPGSQHGPPTGSPTAARAYTGSRGLQPIKAAPEGFPTTVPAVTAV